MSENLKCEVVQDLLPSYIEGLTSKITNEAVEKHIKDCSECGQLLNRMREPEKHEDAGIKEIEYLKKVHHSTRKKVLEAAVVTAMLLIGILGAWVFLWGFEASEAEVIYNVQVDKNEIMVSGSLLDPSMQCIRADFAEEKGIVKVTIYKAPVLKRKGWNDFSKSYTAKYPVKEVYINNLIAYDKTEISRETAQIFRARNPYIGDVSANARLAEALMIGRKLGEFTNELQTTTEPYGWTLIFSNPVSKEKDEEFNEAMKAYGCVLLAMTDNLGVVSWKYNTDTQTKALEITKKEASQIVGKDIKDCSGSAYELQSLLQLLELD